MALQTGEPEHKQFFNNNKVSSANNECISSCIICTAIYVLSLRHKVRHLWGLWLSLQRQEPLFSEDRSRFFLILPVRQGGQGDFHHITMFTKKVTPPSSYTLDIQSLPLSVPFCGVFSFNPSSWFSFQLRSDQDEVRHLTSGDWEVTKIVAYDENNQIV